MTIQLPLSQVEMSMKTDICNKDTVCLILSITEQYSGHTVSRVFLTIIVGVKKIGKCPKIIQSIVLVFKPLLQKLNLYNLPED